ncbi:hypothetical protein JCM8547_007418 [Rhodosporidiobolus lusitaniae]
MPPRNSKAKGGTGTPSRSSSAAPAPPPVNSASAPPSAHPGQPPAGYPGYHGHMQPYPGYPHYPPPPHGFVPPFFPPGAGPSHLAQEQLDVGQLQHDGALVTSGGGGAASAKRTRTSTPEVEDSGSMKRKKRLPLSCGECSRRKIKCDRAVPCGACVRRKRVEFCSFDDEDPVAPYASSSEVRAIGRRLAHLENLFHQHAPHLFPTYSPAGNALAPSGTVTHHPSPSAASVRSHNSPALASHRLPPPPATSSHSSPAASHPSNSASGPFAQPPMAEEDLKRNISDTEDAVADLEEKTFEARVPILKQLQATAEGTARRYNYAKVVDMELTSALTTILAEPLTFDQDGRPRSAVRLGLDLAVSTSDLPEVRHEALAQIYRVLPDEEISRYLLKKYFEEMEWDFRVLDPIAFPVEYERFMQMQEQGREDFIDPLWTSCFCMVLALSLEGFWSRPVGAKDLSLFRGIPESDLKELPSVWHDAALRALTLGEWGGTPRIRTIQTVILMQQYIQLSSSSGQSGRILNWVSSAIRIAQRLGLHRLGSNPETMPPDDPALPPGSNSLKRETAVRLFHNLVNIDSWLSDSPILRSYLLHPSQYNTAPPLNLNFRDLSRTDWRTPPPQPLTVFTDASFELVQCKIAEQIRHSLDTLVLSDGAFSYPAVLEQDKAFREILIDVPDVFSEKAISINSPRVAYQRACLHEDVFSRIVRLNRPLLGRGYAPASPYAYSTSQCIEAAKSLIQSNYNMLQIETSRWFVYTGTLAASLVLMMHIFHMLDHDEKEEAIRETREVLMKARAIFDTTQIATPALTVVVEEGRKILAALFVEEERRRTTRTAHEMASAPPPALETFAAVLKRVSRAIAAQEPPNPLSLLQSATPAPSHLHSHAASASTLAPPHPPFSFAQAAATAMANTAAAPPTPGLGTPSALSAAGGYDPTTAFDASMLPPPVADFSSFFNVMAESEDWSAVNFGHSPGQDEQALLDQLAASWDR